MASCMPIHFINKKYCCKAFKCIGFGVKTLKIDKTKIDYLLRS